MKICGACSQELPKDKFSKKQWQAKQQRRCKDCIVANREVQLEEAPAPSDAAIPPGAGGDGASDENLFKEPPPREECPICFLPRPLNSAESQYQSCCGKMICIGCIVAAKHADDRRLCPFCRTPPPTSNRENIEWLKERAGADDAVAIRTPASTSEGEYIERLRERAEGGDAIAIYNLGGHYNMAEVGLRQNHKKAMKFWFRAGELGFARAYNNLGYSYQNGEGVEKDEKKAKYYWELAAMGGSITARHNLGVLECDSGNMDIAMKHYMIAAGAGYDNSLKEIRQMLLRGYATKDEFERALRAHKEAVDEMKSVQRDAAVASGDC